MVTITRTIIFVALFVLVVTSTVYGKEQTGEGDGAKESQDQKGTEDKKAPSVDDIPGEKNEKAGDGGSDDSGDKYGDEDIDMKDESKDDSGKTDDVVAGTSEINDTTSDFSMTSGFDVTQVSGLSLTTTTVKPNNIDVSGEKKAESAKQQPEKTDPPQAPSGPEKVEPSKDKRKETENGPVASPLVKEGETREESKKEDPPPEQAGIDTDMADEKESEAKKEPENKEAVIPEPPKTHSEEAKVPEAQKEVEGMKEVTYKKNINPGGEEVSQSNFLGYFIVLSIITIIAYLVFHNKKKILGLIVEGRGGRQAGRRRSGGREYRKLDSNMEDMMESGKETSMRQVIY